MTKPGLQGEKSNNIKKSHLRLKFIFNGIEDYLKQSTLHGLQYVGNKSLSSIERIFWIFCCVSAGIFAVYFINNLYQNCTKNALIVSPNSYPTPVQDVPFPAVTICNTNLVRKNIAQEILMQGTVSEKLILEEICEFNNNNSSTQQKKGKDEENWKERYNLMLKTHHPCEEMLRACKWQLNNVDCNRLFNTVFTDEGYCCIFNQLPLNYILKHPLDHQEYSGNSLIRDKYPIDDWNPERGYSASASFNVFPFRTLGRGRSLGLTVVLDVDSENYYCSTTSSSKGFKILLHNPAEILKVSENSFFLLPGYESNIDFTPEITDASEDLRAINVEKRRCYFMDEKNLEYYRIYGKSNCKMECLTNTMLDTCGCVLDLLPRNKSVRVCGRKENYCNAKTEQEINLLQITNNVHRKRCHCYNGCDTLSYRNHISYGLLTGSFKSRENLFHNNLSKEYLQENIAIIHIYLADDDFSAFTTSLLCDFTNLISSTGGLLALFLGFSVLSVVEIFYYLTLKIICNVLRLKRKSRT